MISKKHLIEEAEQVFEKGDSALINSWRMKVIEYLIQQLTENSDKAELRNFYLYFEGQKDTIKGEEYNQLGSEIKNLILIVGDKPKTVIISKLKALKKSLVPKTNN